MQLLDPLSLPMSNRTWSPSSNRVIYFLKIHLRATRKLNTSAPSEPIATPMTMFTALEPEALSHAAYRPTLISAPIAVSNTYGNQVEEPAEERNVKRRFSHQVMVAAIKKASARLGSGAHRIPCVNARVSPASAIKPIVPTTQNRANSSRSFATISSGEKVSVSKQGVSIPGDRALRPRGQILRLAPTRPGS